MRKTPIFALAATGVGEEGGGTGRCGIIDFMNGKALEAGKHKFHWLNVWLDLQIVVLLAYLLSFFYSWLARTDLFGTLPQILSSFIILAGVPATLIVFCVFIQLWRKWAVYGYFALNIFDLGSKVMMFLTSPDAPLKDMIWMSAKSIAFTFVLLLVTWLLIRPFWEQFK
jgi:hypothetical protein